MERKKQLDVISDAFNAYIPEDQSTWPDYYKERMAICKDCDRNTANGAFGIIGKFASKKVGAQCSCCGCVIKLKCWSKNEMCGLGETLEGEPKWNRIVLETKDDEDVFDVENMSYDICNLDLSEDGNEFVFNMKDIHSDDSVEVWFVVRAKKDLAYYRIRMCGCMSSKAERLDNNTYKFGIRLNNPIQEGYYNRGIAIEFINPEDIAKQGHSAEEQPPVAHTLMARIITNVKPVKGDKIEEDEEI